MSSINTITIVGRVGRDPELKTTKSGKNVCELSVATSSKRGGEERTEWHRVTLWEKHADIAGRFLTKGSMVGITGRLTYDQWEKDGQKHTKAIIACEQLTLMGGGKRADESGDRPGFARAPKPYDSGDGRGSSVPDDDDIPF